MKGKGDICWYNCSLKDGTSKKSYFCCYLFKEGDIYQRDTGGREEFRVDYNGSLRKSLDLVNVKIPLKAKGKIRKT